MSTKKGTWEDYLKHMREISNPGPLTNALNTLQLNPDDLEDQYFVFSTYTQGLLVLNLSYYLSSHSKSTDIIDDFINSHREQIYMLLDYSNLKIRSFSPEFQLKYCESILQLYCVFSIADKHYKDEELAILKEILAACKTPDLLDDIKFLLSLAGFIPNRVYSYDNHKQDEIIKDNRFNLLREIFEPVLIVHGGAAMGNAIDWTAIGQFLKDYKDYILFALRGIREWIKRRIKKKEKQKKKDAANQEKEKGLGKNGIVGELPKEPVSGVKNRPATGGHPSITLIPNLIRSYENTIIYGETKIGKTFLGVQLAADLAKGGVSTLFPDEDFTIAPQKVIYYNYEQDLDAIQEKFKDLPFKLDNLEMIDQVVCREKLNTAALLLNDITLRIGLCPVGTSLVVFIDNLNRVVDNANAKKQVNFLTDELEYLISLAKQKNCSLSNIILAHTNKSGELEGAGSLAQRAKCVIAFEEIDEEHRQLTVVQSNSFHSKKPFILKWTKYPGFDNSCLVFDKTKKKDLTDDDPKPNDQSEEKESKEAIIIRLAMEGKTKMEIHIETGISRPTINKYWPKDIPSKQSDSQPNEVG